MEKQLFLYCVLIQIAFFTLLTLFSGLYLTLIFYFLFRFFIIIIILGKKCVIYMCSFFSFFFFLVVWWGKMYFTKHFRLLRIHIYEFPFPFFMLMLFSFFYFDFWHLVEGKSLIFACFAMYTIVNISFFTWFSNKVHLLFK